MSHLNLINDYTWRLIRQELGWELIDNKVPMLPVRERPEFDEQDSPYILYSGSLETSVNTIPAMKTATVQYVIYSGNRPKTDSRPARSKENVVNDAVNLLENAFGQWEESAARINASGYNQANARKDYLDGTSIRYTQVTNTDSADPGNSEGGKALGFIQVRYAYTETPGKFDILF